MFPMQEGTYNHFTIWINQERMEDINSCFNNYSEEIAEITSIDELKIIDRSFDEIEYKICVFACYILWNKWNKEGIDIPQKLEGVFDVEVHKATT